MKASLKIRSHVILNGAKQSEESKNVSKILRFAQNDRTVDLADAF